MTTPPDTYMGVPIPESIQAYWDSAYLSIKFWRMGVEDARAAARTRPEMIDDWISPSPQLD